MKNNFMADELLVHADYETAVKGLLSEMPTQSPFDADPRMETMADLVGFERFDDDTWMSYRKGNIGIMEVNGTIIPEGKPWMTYLGASPLNVMEEEYRKMDDAGLDMIITRYSSPGGTAQGLTAHHNFMRGLKTKTVGYTGSISASASYFAMSANDEIIAEEMGSVGSIGTIIQFHKPSDEIVTIVSDQSPKKDKSDPRNRHSLQERANELTDIFVKYVAMGRNTTTEDVLANFGQGDILLAEKAKERGMIDKVQNFSELLSELSTNTSEEVQIMGESMSDMTMETLQSEHPDLFAKVQKDAQTKMSADLEAKATAEAERVSAIMGIIGELPSMSEAGKNAALEVQTKAVADASQTYADTKASMAIAALGAKTTGDEDAKTHGDNAAKMAEEQGTTGTSKESLMENTQSESLSEAADSVVKMGFNPYGKVGQ